MTSEDRREARYRRRKAKRDERKKKLREHDNFDTVFSFSHLYQSYKRCRRTVAWKSSTQKYIVQAPLLVYQTFKKLQNGKFKSPGFYEFDLYERGKHRHIRSVTMGERVVQRCLCDNALVPMVERTFIYDNGASMMNKGYHFAVNRLVRHLRRHYRKHGTEGYILLFDFTKFFDRVSHELVKKILAREFSDQRIIRLTEHFIDNFGEIGMGLGSQISQVLALASGNRLDHMIKEKLNIRGYGRYMDDGYLIHESKEYLWRCLDAIREMCRELGITLNEKKTQIVKLSHGFTWLKVRFFLLPGGRIVRKIYKRSVARMRQKLKKFRRHMDSGKMTFEDVNTAYQSWMGYAKHFDAWHARKNMELLFNSLFLTERTA